MATSLLVGLVGSSATGFCATALLTWIFRGQARALGFVDRPTHHRSAHVEATPTSGGVAIAGGVLVAVAVFWVFWGGLPGTMQTLPFWGGAFLMLGAGLWDDQHGLDAKTKFALQLGAAYLLMHAGASLQVPGAPLTGGGELGWGLYSLPLSMLWVVGVINAANLIDGLDGLATGIIGIAFLACAALFGVKGEWGLMALGVAVACAAVGFLPHNFNPAAVFMGDSGSLFLGYFLAAYTLQGSLHADPFVALLILPVLLGVPVLDTAVAIARRLASARTIFAPDRGHIHHRLVERGTERGAVLTLYLVGAWFGSAAFLMGIVPARWGYVLAGGTGAVALVWAWRLGCLTPAGAPAEERRRTEKKHLGREEERPSEKPLEEIVEKEVAEAFPPAGGDGARGHSGRATPRTGENGR